MAFPLEVQSTKLCTEPHHDMQAALALGANPGVESKIEAFASNRGIAPKERRGGPPVHQGEAPPKHMVQLYLVLE